MALNIYISRIEAKPTAGERPSKAGHAACAPKITFDWDPLKNNKLPSTLVHVPEDRNIRKFPVRIFDMQAEE